MQPILEVAQEKLGINPDQLEAYGRFKAKIPFDTINKLPDKKGKLILVTALTPTKAGEGKTTVSVGLSDGLCHIGKKSMVALREPSLGPVFGMKGGAAGGGYAQVVPMADINLHFTGDLHAIGTAHNLLSAMVDNHIYHGNEPLIDTRKVSWRRVVDMNDRALRNIVLGCGEGNGFTRQGGFDITVASEVMAIFCLATSLADLKEKLSKIVVGYTRKMVPVTVKELKAEGAMAALLRDALQPNLVQTLEKNPAIIHGGPFANIAHGCSSVLGTQTALKMADYVVTEGGFGADLGAEKFFDIKCRKAGLAPDVVVIVATIRALKYHGGADEKELTVPDVDAVKAGMPNLLTHVNNTKKYGVPVVVAINAFHMDTPEEIAAVQSECEKNGLKAIVSEHWAKGGPGAADLAKEVVHTMDTQQSNFKLLYPDDMPILDKVRTIAQELYGAKDISVSPEAQKQVKRFTRLGYGHYPVCIAKTQYSFSADPTARNAPTGHVIPVREVRLSAGAEFVVVITGDIMTMPGLNKVPSACSVGLNDEGHIHGLF
eukprot:CAMPEP_0175148136 /NCGR_PEP_ID=MMETSP0087-20121206/16433_1 /TAXON_ID=136419 /ORGANISM="Unknown Unknown, Strain D1" /LENGTH=543 /DNA_ID=CAMNT_0016433509 /DNA_START=206 /DNA_END=1837 /DNA_ORIENTATION=+